MKMFVLISCVKKKLPFRAKAKNLYSSTLFRSFLEYARRLNTDAIFVLSAKYGLIGLEDEIEPYDLTLNKMTEVQKRIWAERVLSSLREKADLNSDHFVILAGNNYRKYLIPRLHSYEIPLEGLSFGQQLGELKRRNHE